MRREDADAVREMVGRVAATWPRAARPQEANAGA
jgi:hypothetical protein